jgi:hypothetical protein
LLMIHSPWTANLLTLPRVGQNVSTL